MATGLRAAVALGLSVLGIGIASVGTFWFSPWIVHFGSVLVIIAWALGALAPTAWTRIFAMCCLFAVVVPPPAAIDGPIHSRLQSVMSWGCNGFLDAVGIPNIVEGDVLEISGKKIRLSEMCGGADSFAALLGMGMVLVVLRRSALVVGLVTLLSIPVCYVLANMIRLLAIALAFEYYDADLTTGTGYLVTAVLISFVAVASVLLWHIALTALLEPIAVNKGSNNLTELYRMMMSWPIPRAWSPGQGSEAGIAVATAPILRYRTAIMGLSSLVCVLLGGLAGYAAIRSVSTTIASINLREEQAALLPSQDAFPNPFGSLRMTGFTPTVKSEANVLGKYSNSWKFEDKGSQFFVTFDFPFPGWRPVWLGYQANGWRILKVRPADDPASPGSTSSNIEECQMQNQYGLYGYVWYAFFDDQALPTAVESDTGGGRINLLTRIQKPVVTSSKNYFQVQLFLESGRELTELEIASHRKLYLQIFERIRLQSEAVLKKAQ